MTSGSFSVRSFGSTLSVVLKVTWMVTVCPGLASPSGTAVGEAELTSMVVGAGVIRSSRSSKEMRVVRMRLPDREPVLPTNLVRSHCANERRDMAGFLTDEAGVTGRVAYRR